MAIAETATPAPSKAPADKYESLLAGLSPENRVAFRQANLALVQAQAAYEEAKRAAQEEERKPLVAFKAAKTAYVAAVDKLEDKGGALDRALGILGRLQKEAGEVKAGDLVDPDEAKSQVARLQATLDEYKAGVTAVAAQVQAVNDAALALRKLSQPEPEFDPKNPKMNEMAQLIAKEQKQLAIAQAQIPLDAARDAFDLKLAELGGSKPRRMQ